MRFRTGRVSVGRLILWIAAGLMMANTAWAKTIYVKASAPANGDGTSWAKAYPSLQTGLGAAIAGDEIWVAAGTYKPTTGADRTISFAMKGGVALYGGFAGTETSRDQRNWTANETILSGDLGTTRSYHVVRGANGTLDGVTVAAGCAYGTKNDYGAGILNESVHPVVANCLFRDHDSSTTGSAAFNDNNETTFTNCLFIGNRHSAMMRGTAVNCTFSNNTGTDGGGINNGSAVDCMFLNNVATLQGGGACDTNTTRCTFVENASRRGGGQSGGTAFQCNFTGNVSRSYNPEVHSYGGGMNLGTAIDCNFTSNTAECGGGTYSTTAVGCNFTRNTARVGGGSLGTVTACVFRGNKAQEYGGAVFSGTLNGCIVYENTADKGGGIASASATNCLIVNNSANMGGGCVAWSNKLINCTIYGNTATYGGGCYSFDGSFFFNTIVWDNRATTGSQIYVGTQLSQFFKCDIQDCGGSGSGWDSFLGTDLGGNLAAEPEFVDAAHPAGADGVFFSADDGFNLLDGSPCINKGGVKYVAVKAPTTDIVGRSRVSRVPDIGAYENQTPVPLPQLAVYDNSTTLTNKSKVNFGSVQIGSIAPTKTIVVKNIGTADLLTSSTKTTAPFQIVKAPAARIPAGTSSTLVIAMTTETTGPLKSEVSIESNEPLYPIFILNAVGTVTYPVLKVLNENEMPIDSGGIVKARTSVIGVQAPNVKLEIKNVGTGSMRIGMPTTASPFQIVKAPATSVAASANTTIVISMNTSTTGTFSRTLTIPTDDRNNTNFAVTISGIVQSRAKVLYVSAESKTALQTADIGASWATAYPDLQMAIAAAKPGNEIWVKAGTYKPTTTADRSISFVLPEDVSLYGGFAGTESTLARDWKLHPSILSGNIGTPAKTDNTYNVVVGNNLSVIDGFTISGGYASVYRVKGGGGMINNNVSPRIMNCTFLNNSAIQIGTVAGGAIYSTGCSLTILNCVFQDNVATGYWAYGGAISHAGSLDLVNCVFINNSANNHGKDGYGGALYGTGGTGDWTTTDPGTCNIVNCTFTGNSANGLPDGIEFDRVLCNLTASIVWNNPITLGMGTITLNCCDVQGPVNGTVIDGGGNISADPKFMDAAVPAGSDGIWRTSDDGLIPLAGSPCVNAGTPTPTPPTDIIGKPRVERNDIGAYEYPLRNAVGGWVMYQ